MLIQLIMEISSANQTHKLMLWSREIVRVLLSMAKYGWALDGFQNIKDYLLEDIELGEKKKNNVCLKQCRSMPTGFHFNKTMTVTQINLTLKTVSGNLSEVIELLIYTLYCSYYSAKLMNISWHNTITY